MSLFLVLMIGGLAGMLLMALPGLAQHGHAGLGAHGLGHAGLHAGHGGIHAGHGGGQVGHVAGHAGADGTAHAGHGHDVGQADQGLPAFLWLIPSPRVIFSLMTLFGAFGYGLEEAAHLTPTVAGLFAALAALLMERYAVTPFWNLLFRFEGTPCAPLEELEMKEAQAVTPFRNGRGLVSVIREGRVVQFRAELAEPENAAPIAVGDPLVIIEVDAPKERVRVSRLTS